MLGVQIDGEVLFMDDFIKRVQVEPIVKAERKTEFTGTDSSPVIGLHLHWNVHFLWSWRKW